MKKIINHLAVAMAAVSFTACQPQKSGLTFEHLLLILQNILSFLFRNLVMRVK